MNNFELDDQVETLAATKTNYELAKELILLRERDGRLVNVGSVGKIKADAIREWAGSYHTDDKVVKVALFAANQYANHLERGEL